MTEKITLTPGDVRGLGNIVSHKTEKNFLPVDCRIHTPQQATVDGLTRDVFLVDMSPTGTLVDTYITVDGPSIVELSDEEITFNVALYRSDGVRVKSVPLVCMTGDSVLEVTSDQYGYAEFTVPNTFTEGWYTFTFASQTIVVQDDVRFDNAYRNHSFVVVDDVGEYYFDLIGVENPIQTGSVSHLISRFCVDGVGVPASTVYFFEEYVKSVLRGLASLESFQSGDAVTLSAELKDTDGSAVQEAQVYFFMQNEDSEPYDAILSVSKSQVMVGESIVFTATVVDENGFGVPYVPIDLYDCTNGTADEELISSLVTGADGTATYTYNGTGNGDLAFYLNDGSGTLWSDDVYIEDCFTYGTDITQFLLNEPATPRISSDGNRIILDGYADGSSGYSDVPVILDHVFTTGDKWIMETTIDTPTDVSIVVTVGYPSSVQPGAMPITGGHDSRLTDDDELFVREGTGTPSTLPHTVTANDKLVVRCTDGSGAYFFINDYDEGWIDYAEISASSYYIGFMLTQTSPQFFKDIKIKKITPAWEQEQ